MTPRQPYPGLRAFDRDEADLFFGREGCIDSMVDRLAATRFLAVLGSSGSGKSSLVRTGLLDALELGLLAEAGSRWAVATMRPGGAPLANLARALLEAVGGDGEAPAVMLEAFLRRGPLSLAEWCRDGHLSPGTSLLVLADQFEELFRYGDYAAREEAQAFVALLLEATRQRDVPIHVVLTMRSEFLGACALVPGLAERINAGLYLTPRMTRQETREAIEGPAAVCGFAIEPALVTRLLNDLAAFAPWDGDHGTDQLQALSRRADQLPLMQHVLNRLWLRASTAGGLITLRLADYDDLGGLGGAIDAHAQEILDTLGPTALPLVERVFRALVTGTTVATALRRPCRFADIVAVCDAPHDAVAQVVEAFRAPGCNFLMPPPDLPLADGTIIDISHESLIRQWSRLSAWLEREVDAGATWRRLAAAAQAHAAGRGELLSGRDLGNVDSFWAEQSPAEAWARRHGGGFAAATDYLAHSRHAAAERERAEREQQETLRARDRREKRRLRAGAAVLLVLFLATGGIAWQAWRSEQRLQEVNANLVTARLKTEQQNDELLRTRSTIGETNIELRTRNEQLEKMQAQAALSATEASISAEIARRTARRLGPDLIADLRNQEGMRVEVIRTLLDQADHSLMELLEREPENTDLLAARAVVNLELANLNRSLFNTDMQLSAARRGLELYVSALRRQPHNVDLRRGHADALERLGDALRDSGVTYSAEAMNMYRTSGMLRQELAQEDPADLSRQRAVAGSLDRMATLRLRGPVTSFELGEAEVYYVRAGDIFRELIRLDPRHPAYRRDLAWTLHGLAEIERRRGNFNGAIRHYEESGNHFAALANESPRNTQALRDLSFNSQARGRVSLDMGRIDAAFQRYNEALRFRERLRNSDEANARWQLEAIEIRISLGDAARRLKRDEVASDQGKIALGLIADLERRFPAAPWLASARKGAEDLLRRRR